MVRLPIHTAIKVANLLKLSSLELFVPKLIISSTQAMKAKKY